jgi:hypothetical protein
MMLCTCEYCGKRFNGKVVLYSHKLNEPEFKAKAIKYFDEQIKLMERKKGE